MCLYFNEEDVKTAEKLRNSKKPIIAYKILADFGKGNLCSPLYWFKTGAWVPGKIKKADEPKNHIAYSLADFWFSRCVDHGIHCYRTREAARDAYREYWGTVNKIKQIWKVQINPKDVVMVSNYYGKQIAATKVKLLERVR